ncbi:SVM family protein [Italian clover phyllody phytoplasma]|uniref:SVM family protein n=1 Tax=Italian clover phyllody phytoplasma TaxID=1196420 RepID=UPI000308A0D1|nr:SVM family protein [Italian clover phyllody phytoplasma]
MFKLKNQFKIISIYLFIFLGLFLINNNVQIMAIENNKSIQTIYSIKTNNDRINQNKPMKVSYCVSNKNLSLEDMAKQINIINSIK